MANSFIIKGGILVAIILGSLAGAGILYNRYFGGDDQEKNQEQDKQLEDHRNRLILGELKDQEQDKRLSTGESKDLEHDKLLKEHGDHMAELESENRNQDTIIEKFRTRLEGLQDQVLGLESDKTSVQEELSKLSEAYSELKEDFKKSQEEEKGKQEQLEKRLEALERLFGLDQTP